MKSLIYKGKMIEPSIYLKGEVILLGDKCYVSHEFFRKLCKLENYESYIDKKI